MNEEPEILGCLERESNMLDEYLSFRKLAAPIPTFKFVAQFQDWLEAKANAINSGY